MTGMTGMKAIHEYIKEGDPTLLKHLDTKHRALFGYISTYALTKPGTHHSRARKALKDLGLDERGRSLDIKDRGQKKVEGQLADFSVSLTGARVGDILIGSSKATKGAVMRIHDHNVPPQKSTLDGLRYYPDLWHKFLVKLGSIPFFTNMHLNARELWLSMHEAENENSIGGEGSRIELIQPGTGDFVTKLSEQELDTLIQGNPKSSDSYWSFDEIEGMIPGKAGTQARRHTLILIRSFWKLAIDYQVTSSCKDITLDIQRGEVMKKGKADEGDQIFVVSGVTKTVKKQVKKETTWLRASSQSIGLLSNRTMFSNTEVDAIVDSVYPTDMDQIRHATHNFTGAAFKSLLQKIIRFRPTHVILGKDIYVDAQSALVGCLSLLAVHPGAFVPDIQRYVTGIESMAKRVAVTIYEDSSLPDGEKTLLSMLSGSLLAQRVRTWKPDAALLSHWLEAAVIAWNQKDAVKVDYRGEAKEKPYVLSADNTTLENASAVLDEIRSFPTDLGLARGWARDQGRWQMEIAKSTPEVMPISHCVDHHWAPQVVHYFSPSFVYEICKTNTNRPFGPLFGYMWDKSSGVNPRRQHLDFSTFEESVEEIRNAQHLFLVALQGKHKKRKEAKGTYEVDYTLDDAWIAGLVGAVEVKPPKQPAMLVTLSGDDPLNLVVIRRPSRNMSHDPLSAEAEEAAIAIVKQRLKSGLPLNKAHPPSPTLEDAKIVLIEGTEEGPYYAVRKGGKTFPWEHAKQLRLALPLHKPLLPYSIEAALVKVGTGVEEGADEKLEELVDNTDKAVIRRALVYLSTFGYDIEMNRVSRDGGGTYHAVLLEDVPAYQFILRLSSLYPAAIAPAEFKPSRFTVPIGPLLWIVKDRISRMITGEEIEGEGWKEVKFRDKIRKMWQHQKDVVSDMVANSQAGMKGNFLWMVVGSGKTLCVLSFLQWLKDQGKLPPYVVYTLPESAIKSIINEIKQFRIPINLIIPLADIAKRKAAYAKEKIQISQSCEPVPFAINLIEHDHLRRCEETMMRIAPEMFFIVDEVHRTLNDTKRTSVALELAHLSRDFVVLTGTPVIDNHSYKLIGWLEQIVPYEVNSRNFWVAAASMVAKKFNTGVKVVNEELIAPLNKKEEKRYFQLVPPALGGNNSNPSHNEWAEATEICYNASDREMVKTTQSLVHEGRGVMVVGKDSKHQKKLYEMFIDNGVDEDEIFVLESGESIHLTDEAVEAGKVPDYEIAIVTIRRPEGYTLTRLSAMVTSVYPSNNASREQIRGRLNRLSQKSPDIIERVVHTGVLTAILRHHNEAKNLSIALQSLAQEIEI
jgi:superfamily II DNA or RNA helicase